MNIPHNIYINVPYCISKCNYCAFYSKTQIPDWDAYLADVLQKILLWRERLGKVSVSTIFFGGGTPSLLPLQTFDKIIGALHDNFDIEKNAEITIEANPGTLDANKLKEFKLLGVNRLSVGVQSLNDQILLFLGRRHNADAAKKLIDAAQNLNLSINADFIYGMPEQTIKEVEQMCTGILDLNLNHASIYELTIEPDTPFGQMNLNMPSNETMANMFEMIGDIMSEKLPRYEVSNYAKSGNECKHNMNIWDGAPYVGIGAGACGRVLIDNVWYETEQSKKNDTDLFCKLDKNTRDIENIIMGMRTLRGAKINDAVNMEFAYTHPELVTIDTDRIRTTQKGMLILNDLLVKLIK